MRSLLQHISERVGLDSNLSNNLSRKNRLGGENLSEQALAASDLITYEWHVQKDRFCIQGSESLRAELDLLDLKTSREFHKKIEPPDLALRLDCLSEHMRFEESFMCEYRLICADGSRRWILETGRASFSKDRTPKLVCGTLQDITALKQQEKSYGKLAIFDDLTGAYSVFRLKEMLEHALVYNARYKGQGVFAVVDINNIGEINRKHGYEVGDAVIASITHRMRTQLRSADTLGRLEGDRLGVLLSNCSDKHAQTALKRLIFATSYHPVEVGDLKFKVTVSAGGVRFPTTADTIPDIWQYAEIALEHARQQFKTRQLDHSHCLFYQDTKQDESSLDYTRRVEETLSDALANDGFQLAYQEVINLDENDTALPLYECLLRLKQPQGDIKGPADFIPIAEKTEMMWQIDALVMKLVCQELRRYNGMLLAFNISARTTGNPRWMQEFRRQLKRDSSIAKRMVIEITETAAIGLTSTTIEFIEQLRGYGCSVALDDFGAGYTSFRQLKLLPLDYIKIDGDMVRSFEHNQHNKLFVRTILDLSYAFNLKVIAEGIETPEQRDLLAKEGVQLMQGYLFSKPNPTAAWHRVKAA